MKRITGISITLLILGLSSCQDAGLGSKSMETGSATEVTMDSALLSATVGSDYMTGSSEIGFIVSTDPDPTPENGMKFVAAQIGKDGSISVVADGLSASTTYYYRAFAGDGSVAGEVRQFTTKPFEIVAVDLGLKVKWGNANIGAVAVSDYGNIYAWGEIKTKSDYSWESYKWSEGSEVKLTKYNFKDNYGVVDNKPTLDKVDDVANATLGGKWRMPTETEIKELAATFKNTSYKWEWVAVDGHHGYKVTYLPTGKNIFLPAGGFRVGTAHYSKDTYGFYWSASLSSEGYYSPVFMEFYQNSCYCDNSGYQRYNGFTIRPVKD